MNAIREGGENRNFSVVAETMKLQANSSYVSQKMERSRHTEQSISVMKTTMELSITNRVGTRVI